jgi:hypothetical protein
VDPPAGRWLRFRQYLGERRAAIALLLVAPAIPELLTGSTPITRLVLDPPGFLVSFGLDIGLYGTGALLIREFAIVYRKGWASILLLGAAYGIAEEGFAVHTFFQRTGSPVNTLGSFGHAFGVNWLWALGLTVFHATYSIALPILWVHLWFPAQKGNRWLGRGSLVAAAVVYAGEVVIFGILVPHGPSPAAFLFFLVVVAILVIVAIQVPAGFLSVRAGATRLGRTGLVLAGTLGFDAWVVVLLLSGTGRVPAALAAVVLVAIDLAALALILRTVGRDDLLRSEYRFTTGMLLALFAFDLIVEFTVPGILGVALLFAWLQYRLGRRIPDASPGTLIPSGVAPPPLTP